MSATSAVEALIDIFRRSAYWSAYCAAASPDSGEETLRQHWLQIVLADHHWLKEDDLRLDQLWGIERLFLSSFVELARNGAVRVWHRLLSRHHATAEHHPTPQEMFDNAGICVDRGEILVQPSRTPPIKLVMITASKPTEAELEEFVRDHHRQCAERGVRPSLRALVAETRLPRGRLRGAWISASFPLPHGGRR